MVTGLQRLEEGQITEFCHEHGGRVERGPSSLKCDMGDTVIDIDERHITVAKGGRVETKMEGMLKEVHASGYDMKFDIHGGSSISVGADAIDKF